jgi:hypothetical protein
MGSPDQVRGAVPLPRQTGAEVGAEPIAPMPTHRGGADRRYIADAIVSPTTAT